MDPITGGHVRTRALTGGNPGVEELAALAAVLLLCKRRGEGAADRARGAVSWTRRERLRVYADPRSWQLAG